MSWPGGAAIGIDVGKIHDPTVVVVLSEDWRVTLVERFPVGIKYQEIVDQLGQYVNRGAKSFVDATGIGDPVLEMLREQYPGDIVGIKITGGNTARTGGREWRVPKTFLMDSLSNVLGRKLLKVTAPEPGRTFLKDELKDFHILQNNIRKKYGAKSGAFDDCVLALSLAVFGRIAS